MGDQRRAGGVVHQYVDPSPSVDGFGDKTPTVLVLIDIGLNRRRLAAGGADLVRHALRFVPATRIVDDDLPALRRAPSRHARAQAPPAAPPAFTLARKSVAEGKGESVRLDHWGRR